jgi:uncharacterized protein
MKYLVLILIIVVVALLAKAATRKSEAAKRPASDPKPRPTPAGAQAGAESGGQMMLVCAHCGLHLPRDEALPGHEAANRADRPRVYCTEAHRALAESRDAGA